MAGEIRANQVINANVYLDGENLLGQAAETNLPEIAQIYVDHVALGLVGKIKLPAGVDAMQATFKWNSFYADTYKKMAHPNKAYQLQVRCNLEVHTSAGLIDEQPLVCYLTGRWSKLPMGNFKPNDKSEQENTFEVTHVKLEIAGEEIVEFDAFANIYKVDGVDVLLEYKTNIGQ